MSSWIVAIARRLPETARPIERGNRQADKVGMPFSTPSRATPEGRRLIASEHLSWASTSRKRPVSRRLISGDWASFSSGAGPPAFLPARSWVSCPAPLPASCAACNVLFKPLSGTCSTSMFPSRRCDGSRKEHAPCDESAAGHAERKPSANFDRRMSEVFSVACQRHECMYVLFVTGTRIRFEYREMRRKKQEEKRSGGFTTRPDVELTLTFLPCSAERGSTDARYRADAGLASDQHVYRLLIWPARNLTAG